MVRHVSRNIVQLLTERNQARESYDILVTHDHPPEEHVRGYWRVKGRRHHSMKRQVPKGRLEVDEASPV